MSTEEKSLCIIEFTGKHEHWEVWFEKFLAHGKRKGYTKLLLCKKNEVGINRVPSKASKFEAMESGNSGADKKVVELGNLNEFAYEDLILSINGNTKAQKVAFSLVKNCKSDEFPEGNCKLAWDRQVNKYSPKTAPSYVKLKKKFTNSKLESSEEDPDKWITELESLRTEMDNINISGKMTDTDFIIHILSNLPEENEVATNALEEKMEDTSSSFTIDMVQTKLNARFKRMRESQEKHSEEKALAAFKKRYESIKCGQDKNAESSEDKNNAGNSNTGARNTFPWKCHHCGEVGHM